MNTIDFGCKSFATKLLFSILISLALISGFVSVFPNITYWGALAFGVAFDLTQLSLRIKKGDYANYVAHLRTFIIPSSLGIAGAYFIWALIHGIPLGPSVIMSGAVLCLVLIERFYLWKETSLYSGFPMLAERLS